MNINATLIVQAINFGIAYILLKQFFFKPVYGAIQQDEAKKDALENVIAKQESRISLIQEDIDNEIKANRAFFKEHIPQPAILELKMYRGIVPEVTFIEPTRDEIVSLAQHAEQVITSLVGKAHE